MYRARFPIQWSPYHFDEAACAIAALQLGSIATRLGFQFPRESVEVAQLEHSTALRIGCGPTNEDRDYLEYPFVERTGPESPIILKPRMTENLLRHLHGQRWRAMRRAAMHGKVGRDLDMHYDCTELGRWASTLHRSCPDMFSSHLEEYHDTYPIEVKVTSGIRTPAGGMTVRQDGILLPLQLPETVKAGMTNRRLRDVLTLPSCGDEALDAAVMDESIYKVEDERSNSRERTRITTYSSLRSPMDPAGADEPWRRLRAIRTDCDRIAPKYDDIDVEATAAKYHAQCDEALGTPRRGLIPYPYAPEMQEAA